MPLLESVLTDSTSWLRFGHYLGLRMDDLHKIESTYGHDIKRCVKQVLFHWRFISPQSTYKEISKALEASGYLVASAIVTRRCSMNKQESVAEEEGYVFIEEPRVKEFDAKTIKQSTGLYNIIRNGTFLFYITIIINSYEHMLNHDYYLFSEFDVLCQELTSFPNGNLMCM